jgi:hypothetical protein
MSRASAISRAALRGACGVRSAWNDSKARVNSATGGRFVRVITDSPGENSDVKSDVAGK